ncbi:cell division protein FtsK [Frankia sp. R43]|nr:cell division protein FtsK [Frankia sp. R43]
MWITCTVALPAENGHPRAADGQAPAQSADVRTVLIRAAPETPMRVIADALAASRPGGSDNPGSGRHPPSNRGRPPSGRGSPLGGRERHPATSQHRRVPAPSVQIDGVEIDAALRLGASPLRDGSLVGLGTPLGQRREALGLVELRVTGGPGSGAVYQLAAGEYGVGADPLGGIVLPEQTAPPQALTLRIEVDGSCVVTPTVQSEVWIDGCRRTGPVTFSALRHASDLAGLAMQVGGRSLLLTAPSPPDALLRPEHAGSGLEISREPRLVRWAGDSRYRLPVLPTAPPAAPPPVLAALLPAVAAGGMAVVLHAAHLLLFAALAPLSLLGSHLAGKRRNRRDHRRALAEYQHSRADVERDAAAALQHESAVRRASHPDAAAVMLRAVGPRRGLWERRPEDPDFLHLRVGTGDVPSRVRLEDPAAPDHRRTTRWMLRAVPVTVPLPDIGVLGVVGASGFARRLGFWLVSQAAALHSPRDLAIHLAVDPAAAPSWEWTRWLPHCRPAGGPPGSVHVGADGPGRARLVDELVALTEARLRLADRGAGSRTGGAPAILAVIEGAATLRAALIPVLRSGPGVGIHVVCLEHDPRLLPPECVAVVDEGPAGVRLRQQGHPDIDRIQPDLVGGAETPSTADRPRGAPRESISTRLSATTTAASESTTAAGRWCERLARALAPLRDPGPQASGGTRLPTDIRLLDLLELDPPSSRVLAPRWITAGGAATFPIGVCPTGAVNLDLSRDGPHALVAGTTGAGKSELLQSLVASLAIHNRPDEMTFVLIDYKGGSAFGDCARLPHTVGLVTDLDPHLVQRALDSLGAELRRRESLFAAAGCKDIGEYRRAVRTRRARPAGSTGSDVPGGMQPDPLPRLVVVVDEFAALVRELPDFVTGLVGLAGRGRSLGMHLVLATQRPAGVVSPEILANTNLRIALRVTDPTESTDVLGLPDAARLPVSAPGRAILRVGQDPPVVFQTARIGGARRRDDAPPASPSASASASAEPLVIELPWPPADEVLASVIRAESEARSSRQVLLNPPAADEPTDLRLLADALQEAARVCRLPSPRRPWLAPLPIRTTIAALPPIGASDEGTPDGTTPEVGTPKRSGLRVPLGLADLCRAQAQPTLALDLEGGSHLLVLGAPRSGRSTVLRTLAGSVSLAAPPADVHIYGLDCGNNSLAPVADLPHTGAVVTVAETERVHRLLARLAAEVARRQILLSQGGFADLAEARQAQQARCTHGAASSALPYLLLLLDGYEGFLASFENLDGAAAIDRLLALARDGPAVGLRIVVTADRRGLTGQLASTIDQRLVLRMAERADYGLAGLAGLRVPEALPPGRGYLIGGSNGSTERVWAESDGPVEVQVALLTDDPSGPAQAGMLRRLAAARAGPARQRPEPGGTPSDAGSPGPQPAIQAGPAVQAEPRPFRVDGLPARVGRRALRTLSGSETGRAVDGRRLPISLAVGGDELAPVSIDLVMDGPGFVIAGPPRSGRSTALLTIAGELHTRGCRTVVVSPRPSPLRDLAGETATQIVVDVSGADQLRYGEAAPAGSQTVFLVDDVESVTGTPLGEELAALLRDDRADESRLVAAGTTEDLVNQFRGLVVDARRSRCGVLLTPTGPADGDLFGVRLPRALCGPGPPGRGLLIRRGEITPIQVVNPLLEG